MNLKLDRIFKIDNGSKLKGSATVIIDDCFDECVSIIKCFGITANTRRKYHEQTETG